LKEEPPIPAAALEIGREVVKSVIAALDEEHRWTALLGLIRSRSNKHVAPLALEAMVAAITDANPASPYKLDVKRAASAIVECMRAEAYQEEESVQQSGVKCLSLMTYPLRNKTGASALVFSLRFSPSVGRVSMLVCGDTACLCVMLRYFLSCDARAYYEQQTLSQLLCWVALPACLLRGRHSRHPV
jgi:hypothetical protein